MDSLLVELTLPAGFGSRVFVQEELDPSLLPQGPWLLMGDQNLQATWRQAGMPEPVGSRWLPIHEADKRLSTLIPWLEAWAQLPLGRNATVVAVGGGVLTDMVGLAAALYMRGIRWQAWPTTLLAQVDAGLGGKTGVDLEAGKNLAGAFHPPEALVVCRSFLHTLEPRQVAAGTWEMIKMALLEGDQAWAEQLLDAPQPDAPALLRALLAKAEIVSRDPLEAGERRLLNLGHTLGHALEAASDYRLLHGEAVGLGVLAACFLAESTGLAGFPAPFLARLSQRLRPLAPLVAPWEACLPLLGRDKKTGPDLQGLGRSAIHCILPHPGHRAEQTALFPEAWAPAHKRLIEVLL